MDTPVPDVAAAEIERLRSELAVIKNQLHLATRGDDSVDELMQLYAEQEIILNTVSVGICRVRSRHIQWMNRQLADMFGYSNQGATNVSTHDFYACEEDYERVGRESLDCFTKGGVYQTELRMRKMDGSLFWCSIAGQPMDLASPDKGSIWSFQDVTERHRAVEALRLSEARLEAAQAQACIGSWELELPDREGYWSREMYHIFGYDVNRPKPTLAEFMERIHPDDRQELVSTQESVVRTGRVLHLLNRSNPALGPVHYYYGVINPLRDESGKITKISGTIQDITARILAEKRSQENQTRLELALDATDMGIWDLDVIRGTLKVSKRWLGLFGYEDKPETGTSEFWRSILHPDNLATAMESYRRHCAGLSQCIDIEVRIRDAKGNYHWVHTKGKIVERDTNGNPTRALGTNLDITEHKQREEEREHLQEQLQQAMKMEAVGRLAGGIAHDFNNLLTIISGYVELSREDLPPDHSLAPALTEIAKAADSAATLTRQLLAFSRRQIIEPRVLNLNDQVSNLRKMLTRLLGEDIELRTNLAPYLGSVRVDPGQFDQVIINLCINSRDAMPSGGRIIIDTANLTLDEAYASSHPGIKPGDYVMFAVSDDGQGMSPETKKRLFEPFFTTKPPGKGTGLGLAMIFGVVKQAGGSIEVYSEYGLGTTFKLYLPRLDLAPDHLASQASRLTDLHGSEAILLVEDDASVRDLAAHFLTRLGYRLLTASNGHEALEKLAQTKFPVDLLLTDIVMPGMNGRELAQKVRELHPGVSILFTSGYTEDMVVRHGIMDEQLAFIGKPYAMQALAAKVRRGLDARIHGIA